MDSAIQFAVRTLFSVPALASLVAVLSVYLAYRVAYEPFNYWKKRGVPQVDVKYPLIGNFFDSLHKPVSEVISKAYNDFPEERFVGTYTVQKPSLMIRDPDLVEAVLIKDFSVYSNRANVDDPKSSQVAKHLVNLKEEHWKNMRNKLTPTFTSGKLRGMHSQLVDCASSLLKYMEKLGDGRPFEVRDVISRFTMDVIASCAFGLNIDTINDPESEFRQMGLAIFKPTLKSKIIFSLRILPKWALFALRKLLGTSFASMKSVDFFVNAVNTTVEYRKKNNVTRPDFLQLMSELKERDEEMVRNKEIEGDNPFLFDHSSLVSNAFVFFLAGFETTATTVSYAMYELAVNPDVQNRAHEEVVAVMKEHGQPDYDACKKMKYLEMVISETLRKYPPATNISRESGAEHRIPGTDVVLPEGTVVVVPIYALHHDPQYYPEPDKFLPERFDEEKDAVRKGTYLPFGGGPRICIGSRFAKLEAKVCLAMILQNYEIIKCDETRVPLKFEKNASLLVPEGGIWVSVKPRAGSN